MSKFALSDSVVQISYNLEIEEINMIHKYGYLILWVRIKMVVLKGNIFNNDIKKRV
jgi:hypothetical protein